jgi:hypothetical protein
MPDDTASRRHLLATALVGALLPADVPEGRMMRAWLDSWAGVRDVTIGDGPAGDRHRRRKHV